MSLAMVLTYPGDVSSVSQPESFAVPKMSTNHGSIRFTNCRRSVSARDGHIQSYGRGGKQAWPAASQSRIHICMQSFCISQV